MVIVDYLINNLNTNPISLLNLLIDPWFNRKERPVFFDIGQTCQALRAFELNYDVILEELYMALGSGEVLPYHEVDKIQRKLSQDKCSNKKWNTFFFKDLLGVKPRAKMMCPKTDELISNVPNVTQAFFSILEGGKSIPKHRGPYHGYLRYHLGLIIPKDCPPTFHINGYKYTWKEKEAILFDDSFEHWVSNESQEQRVLLIIDILRPLPYVGHKINLGLKSIVESIYRYCIV